MTRLLVLALLFAAGGAQASEFWSSLWRNADQRGEQLLRQGDAATAARTYADPRRRAYAEFLAGDYAAAARGFAAFDDADAHYNRGNALAHAGDLKAAVRAYDAALARDARHADARRNREWVARALKQPPPPPPKQGSGEGPSAKRHPENGSENRTKQDAAAPAKPVGEGTKPSRPETRHGREHPSRADPAAAGRNPAANSEAEQARRDAEAGMQGEAPGGEARKPGWSEAPNNERQLAQEQWLQQIPDDPGGLLRRKFMIESLMRKQGNPR